MNSFTSISHIKCNLALVNMMNIITRTHVFENLIHGNNISGYKGLICRLLGGTQRKLQYSDSAAYGGDGKTTVKVLNNEEVNLNLVNTYSAGGFRLSNNLFIYGSILLFPLNVYCWNVRRGIDITPESLLIFDLIVPKVKIVVIGYGENGEPYDPAIPLILKKKGISCEMLATPHAVTTYNYLVSDSVHAAGAFIPVKKDVIMSADDIEASKGVDHVLEKRSYFPSTSAKDSIDYWNELDRKNELKAKKRREEDD